MAGRVCSQGRTTTRRSAPNFLRRNWPQRRQRLTSECANIGKPKTAKLFLMAGETAFAQKKIMEILKCWWIGKSHQKEIVVSMCADLLKCRYGSRKVPDNSIRQTVQADYIIMKR